MARTAASQPQEAGPESDRFEDMPHPRDSYSFFGHAEAEKNLLLSYMSGHLPHAIIIGGPAGTGKATFAWRLARFLLANPDPAAVEAEAGLFVPPAHSVSRQISAMAHPDLILLRREWNPETKRHFVQIQIEDIRRAIHMFQQAAGRGGYRICILDCAEDLNQSSANALLKLIEEPPPASLFLIIAHRPARVLPTLRSRCQKISFKPLSALAIRDIVAALGPPWSISSPDDARLRSVIARAQGSIHNVLRLLDPQGHELDVELGLMLDNLPQIDWSGVHALADRIAARNPSHDFETMLAMIEDWLDARVWHGARTLQGPSAELLAPYALVWEKLGEAARETEVLNLDKRSFVLSLFTDLAAAVAASSS